MTHPAFTNYTNSMSYNNVFRAEIDMQQLQPLLEFIHAARRYGNHGWPSKVITGGRVN